MSTPAIVDFDKLLAPISDEAAAGLDLRADGSSNSLFYRLKDARDAAREAERRQSDEILELEPGDDPPEVSPMVREWRSVLELGETILAAHSKDLTVVAAYTEALVRDKGFAGLRDGCRLIAGLVEGFWDDLHPLPNEDGYEDRIGPIVGMNGNAGRGGLLDPVRNIALTDGAGRFAAWHYQMAHRGAGLITVDQFNSSRTQTPDSFYELLLADIDEALAALEEMSAAFGARMGAEAPGIYALRDAVDDIGRIVRSMAPAATGTAGTDDALVEGAADGGTSGAAAQATPPGPASAGVIQTREDAFKTLTAVATFFRRTEPHSPIAYTLEELVRRGRMPLYDLLRQLIPDDTARMTFIERAGMRHPDEQTGDS